MWINLNFEKLRLFSTFLMDLRQSWDTKKRDIFSARHSEHYKYPTQCGDGGGGHGGGVQ